MRCATTWASTARRSSRDIRRSAKSYVRRTQRAGSDSGWLRELTLEVMSSASLGSTPPAPHAEEEGLTSQPRPRGMASIPANRRSDFVAVLSHALQKTTTLPRLGRLGVHEARPSSVKAGETWGRAEGVRQ